MTSDLATRWANTVVPSWLYRWLMPAVWLAATVVTFATTEDVPCTEDPTICAPDPAFALTLVPFVASLVLWWWRPGLAAVAGVGFFAAQVWYDGGSVVPEWALFATGCLALGVWMAVSRHKQAALTAEPPRRPVMVPAARPLGPTGRIVVAVVLVVVGAAALGVMRWQDQQEQTHVRRAIEQTAVAGQTYDGDLELKLPDGNRRVVSVLDNYEPGTSIAVLIDPADDDWVRLRIEPADHTGWYAVAGGAWLLAIILVLRDIRRRRARPRRSWTAPGLPVRVSPDASLDFVIRSADGDVVLGLVSIDLDDPSADDRLSAAIDGLDDEEEDVPPSVRDEWSRTVSRYDGEALLVGELAEGSWLTLMVGDTALRPAGPLRAPRRTPWSVESFVPLDSQAEIEARNAWVEPRRVDPARELPTLPWTVPVEAPEWWLRVALVGVLLVAPAAGGLFASWGDWIPAIGAVAGGATLLRVLGDDVFYRVVASATELRIRRGWFDAVIDWQTIDAVEFGAGRLTLRTGADWHLIGSLGKDQAAGVAAVFEALRIRARSGLPATPGRRQLNPQALVEGGFYLACVAVVVLVRLV